MKIQMKLKYTLVFTIISFFISTAGFAQQYTDQEIGLNIERLTASLKERKVKDEDISFKISEMRKTYTVQYIESEKRKNEVLQQISLEKKQKESTNRKATATAGDLAQDKAALIALYNSTNGANWTNTKNGQGAWPVNDPSAVVTTWDPVTSTGWYGVTVNSEGRVERLDLENNNLSGTIPAEIGSISLLEWLDLDYNKLTGNIPPEIGQLTSLFALTISSNELTGSIPSQIGQLINVRWMHFGENQLTGTIPPEIAQCQRLYQFIVHYNQLSGSVIPEFGLMPNLENLYLSHNQFTGTIPVDLRLMTKIGYLDLSYNKLTGTIPVEITQCSNLYTFDLENNQLTGTIPSEIGLLTNLISLRLDNNQFTGPIPPELVKCQKLSQFTIAGNQFSGPIPSFLGSLTRLSYVWLTNNKFTGPIPKELGQCKELNFLRLDWNQLTGSIPAEFSNLKKLEVLNLMYTNLEGVIPDLTGTSLRNLYLGENKLRFTDFPIDQFLYYSANIPTFQYISQAKIDSPKTITDSVGTSITLKMYEDDNFSPSETFQWYKGPQQTPIVGATSREYTIPRLKLSDAGTYICRSRHPQITQQTEGRGLILEREPIKLEVFPCVPIEGAIKTSTSTFVENTNITFSFETTDTRILTYKWTFYNSNNTVNSTGTTSTIQKMFNASGNYKVELRTTDENECENIYNLTINVICATPIGEITVDQQTPTTNQTLTFSFTTAATNISWYSWTFYNPDNTISAYGSSSTARNYFTYEGTCRVKLEVTTTGGCKTIFEKNITVVKPPCVTVTGAIKTSVENITANQDFKFSLETTNVGYLWYKWTYYNADGTVLSTEDGSNSTGYKYYPLPGNYRVNLVVRDSYDCTTSFDKIITIAPQICPTVNGTIKTTSENLFVNANTNFYFDTTNSNLNYQWTFYDLNNNITETYDGNYIQKSFDKAGNYKVSLTTKDQNRCEAIFTKTVTVTQPQACATPETGTITIAVDGDVYANENTSIYFNSTDADLHCKWTFYNPDNTIYDSFSGNYFYISFENIGNHRVTVDITDINGCTASYNKTFSVIQDCRKEANIYTSDYNNLEPVLPNTEVSVLLDPRNFNLNGMLQDWEFTNPSGEIITTGSGNIFNVTPTTIGNYKINVKITDPVTGCINNFSKILQSVDQCTFTDKNRFAYISQDGGYAYSNMALYYNLNDTVNFGLYRPWYNDTGKVFNLEWSLYSPNSELISTSNEVQFPITLTSPGFYKLVANVIDPDTGCSTQLTRSISSMIQGSCTETNERSYHIQDLVTNLVKRLIIRSVVGETDAQINANSVSDEFTALKPFITNSPKDKVYNFVTTRNEYDRLSNVTFSFSPDRTSDIHISFRDGLNLTNTDLNYLENRIRDFIIIDLSQYVSSDQYLGSCSLNYPSNRNQAKSIIEPDGCFFSSEIKNINFCPPPCTSITGTLKQSTPEVFVNRNTNFSFETTAADLSYKWTFYNLGNQTSTVYTTSSVDKTYTQQGSYNISLEITDSNGCITSFDKTVVVTLNTNCTPISGTIKTSTPDVFVGRNTNFSLETTATDLSYKWTFTQSNESTIFTTKTVDYIYIQPGTNNVILEVTDSNGCKSTFQKLVELKTGSTLCNDVTQFGRAFVQVGTDTNLYKSATVSANQTTNITFSSQNYGPGADFEYKWSLLNENNQLVDSGTNLIFPIMPTRGGLYTVVLDLKENTTGCIHQFTRAVVCTISNSCAQTNPESATVKGLVINLLKNLMARAMMGESDSQINSSAVTAEFNALKPYITSGPKDKIYNFTSTRNLNGEFTSVAFSFSPDRVSDIYISVPHGLQYSQGMPLDYLQSSMIEPKLYIDLSQYTSANQYLISCLSDSQSAKGLLKPNDCVRASEIRYINFCPENCNTLVGSIKTNSEIVSLNTPLSFSVETTATVLNYNWTFYNSDNTVKETQSSAISTQTYTVPGTYTIVVIATDSNNCQTTFTKTIKISSCIPVIGSIKTVTEAINEFSTTNFYFDTTATDLTYQWTFYRNINSNVTLYNTNSVNHYYDVEGSYNIKLIVTDANGCQTIFRKTAVVTKPVCNSVIGTVTTVSNNVFVNKYTQFYLQTDATDLQYSWSFYNLSNTSYTTYTDPRPYHPFYVAGNYNIVLAVRDQNGCVTTFNKVVTVTVQPPCVEVQGELKIPSGLIATGINNIFSLETQATNISKYNWTFYNLIAGSTPLSTQSTSTASQVYLNPGQYLVSLITTDENDCTTTFQKYIEVVKLCDLTGSITIPTETITTNQQVPFSLNTTETNLAYTWTFYNSDNTIRSVEKLPTVSKSYTSPGTYRVTLDIVGKDGCKISFEKTITVTGQCAINGNITVNPENPILFSTSNFNFETDASDLKYNWTLYNPDNSIAGRDNLKSPNFYFQGDAGDYRITLEVSDSNGCTLNLEKTYNLLYNCDWSKYNGVILNMSNWGSPNILINAPNEFVFYPYSNVDLNEMSILWEVLNSNGEIIESATTQEYSYTPTILGNYTLRFKTVDSNGCINEFSTDLEAMDACGYTEERIDGSINFENENNSELLTILINQSKDLIFIPTVQTWNNYTYKWEIYNSDEQLISTGNQNTHNLTLTTSGFYKVNFDIENEGGCIKHFTKTINCLIENSCTKDNPNSKAVKKLYVNLLKNLISRSLKGETDAEINASPATAEFNALIPYITNGTKDKIYNYTTVREQNKLISIRFSFSLDRDYDTQVLLTKGLWNFDPEYDGTFKSFTSRLVSEIYIDIEQFITADQYLISCYNQTPQINQAAKSVLGKNDCYKETEIRYIDFCPASACAPAEGGIKDIRNINISSKSTNKIKTSSRSKI